ncbi:right-handed parallel beta-helix repeat-containing protein [Actinoallomurus sp. NBC_01490]|uniref:right-handed parallel beta-helix repeat-containing protein n=1 Tax=Actinoallomurus sp. NBC_01490 TaxID=2903557 RepID=UPI002E2F4B49|nr:right-handed parallel beta-helix repeat-containing protein [Actinoallomurus sp. NBC_01490]
MRPKAGRLVFALALAVADLGVLGGTAGAADPPLAIVPTDYPIPSGALFVSPSGDDSAAGDQTHPLKTVHKAVTAASAGGTIVIRQGTYRESLGSIGKKLTLQPYPGEQVWFNGASVVASSRFTADGATWRLDGWDPPICQPESGTPPAADLHNCVNPDGLSSANPIGADPEMVFVDGTPLTEVTAKSAVGAGKFYYDSVGSKLYIGTAPTGHTVEVADKKLALQLSAGAAGTVVRGLGFIHYASAPDETTGAAALISQAQGAVFEKDTIALNAAGGLSLSLQSGMRVSGNLLLRNGYDAILTHKATDLTVEDNQVYGNNTERLGMGSSAITGAGMKATRLRDSVVRDNVFDGNTGTGFWCDLACNNVQVLRNVARGNSKHGLYYEVSAHGLIASNLSTGNGGYGLKISGSAHVRTYNNTFAGNAQAIEVAEDPRPTEPCDNDLNRCPTAEDQALGVTYDTADVTLVNNIFAGATGESAALFDTVANKTTGVGAAQMIPAAQMDHNGYYRASATAPGTLVNWQSATAGTSYTSLPAFQATGRDAHGLYQEGSASYFTDAAGGDYRVVPGSPAETAGAALPADVATAIGVSSGTPVALGALAWPGRSTPGTPTPVLDTPVTRLHHPQNGDTLLTASGTEATNAVQKYGYVSDGTAFYASGTQADGMVPVYRLQNATTHDRLYTTTTSERDSAVADYGYTDEGVKFYVAGATGTGLVPVYRLQKSGLHTVAVGDAEKNADVADGWNYEKVLFYARSA